MKKYPVVRLFCIYERFQPFLAPIKKNLPYVLPHINFPASCVLQWVAFFGNNTDYIRLKIYILPFKEKRFSGTRSGAGSMRKNVTGKN